MARINLLPWREELRRERQRRFLVATMVTVVLGVILVFITGLVFDSRISYQEARNQRIKNEIAQLEVRIRRIEQLEQTRARLLSRKRVIEQLQASRSLTVELMDKLAKSIPVGVTLSTVRQQGQNVTLAGYSQSNARVSAYLQSLEKDDLFLQPDLNVVRTAAVPQSDVEPYEFNIRVTLRPAVKSEDEMGLDEFEESQGGAP
ncbi:MAG: pilus assembly protein PilN [Xanthomonadales bacterium]|nr:pilus assembly protein PilN [Xanthomonadales bacterium]NIN58719.1 pilus assembly protein PilN [Xanthomonadales bacterium]NIN73985.1 pilus assembly protein PilN [Xanthomonadales bacterium]NIO12900.1 pilus assembly protein PilN [Xanthomonadales bacterium]NIP11112.1 pilus assembly protein PilN [Xanthomonadales bacterium]